MPDQLFDLSGKIAVVTGAASGLGQAIAIGFARHGADIVVADVNDDGLAETTAQIKEVKPTTIAVHCDISIPQDVDNLFATLDQTFGRVDVLVNDPFTFARVKPEDMTLEDWNRAMAVNITGYFLCSQAAGRRMIKQGTGGSIINMSSIGGSNALGRGNFVYGVSKGAVNQFTRDLAVEWAKHNIRVNALQPCQMRTPSVKRWLSDPKTDPKTVERLLMGIPMNRLGEPDDIVGPAIFLASDASAFVTGVLLPVDGGNLALNAGGSHTW